MANIRQNEDFQTKVSQSKDYMSTMSSYVQLRKILSIYVMKKAKDSKNDFIKLINKGYQLSTLYSFMIEGCWSYYEHISGVAMDLSHTAF